ncbi:TorF family putative porin [Pyruvatibacter sp.]|uniref:TorF family putative porin n=1 Tax=Pyruvatibacter sp. TaxID=1981328 RepID=UPI0032ED1259
MKDYGALSTPKGLRGLKLSASALVLAAASFAAQPALAEEAAPADDGLVFGGELSGNVGFYTDYIYRGVSQTNNEAAIQGGIDWAHTSGFYIGAWGSNVDFNDGDQASVEVDVYGGFSNSLESLPALSYDVGVLYYWYPGATSSLDYDFVELYGSIGYDFDFAAASFGLAWSPEFFGDTGDAYYYQLGLEVPLPFDVGFAAGYNFQEFEEGAQDDYQDWNVGLGYTLYGLDLSLTYSETVDLGTSDNEALTFGVGYSF